MKLRLIRLVLFAVPAGSLHAQASVFQGPPGGPGDVLVFAAPGAAPSRPAELQGIKLLPIDACGRTPLNEFLPGEPRLRGDVPLASRIVLPQGQGSLYRFRREGLVGADFGYFVVRPSGEAAFLASFPGTGGSGVADPIPDPVGIGPQGDAILVATTTEAGGDLYEIELDTLAVHLHTSAHPPLTIQPGGLCLLQTWGTAISDVGPLRFPRGSPAPAQVLDLPRPARAGLGHNRQGGSLATFPTYFGPGIVRSADGGRAAVVAGTGPTQTQVFVFGPSGAAAVGNDLPAELTGAGFLPDHLAGPTLALSPDGSKVAWKTDGVSGECFVRRVPGTPVPSEVQITADASFADTLNDTGVISFFDPESVVILVGERDGLGGIEKGDFYRATFPAGGGALTLTNLSNTSGDSQEPFLDKGLIDSEDGLHRIPGADGILFYQDGSSGQGMLKRLDAEAGTVELVRSGVSAVEWIELAGTNFVTSILHDEPEQRELLRIPSALHLPARSLGMFDLSESFPARCASPAGTFAATLSVPGGEWLGRVHFPTGAGGLFSTTPRSYGPTLGFDGSGLVLGSVVVGPSTYYFAWGGPGAIGLYPAGGGAGFVLPGA
jgi:hypothetical protein